MSLESLINLLSSCELKHKSKHGEEEARAKQSISRNKDLFSFDEEDEDMNDLDSLPKASRRTSLIRRGL